MYQAKSSLEVAVEAAARVDAVLAKKGKIKPNAIASVLATANKSTNDLFQTEFEINDVPLTARNLLTKGITQEEINHFSGASISTRGRYVTPEDRVKLPKTERPLYLFIQGPNKQSLDLAIQRIDSLIKEVMEQEKFKMGPPPTLITMQTSLPGMEKVIVGLDNAPQTFDVRNKVLGPAGANLQYISNETGAIVTLRGRNSGYPEAGTGQESPEPLHICVEHQKAEVLQAARQLAFNLVDTIQQEFAQLQPQVLSQPGTLQTVSLQPDQLPPGLVATSLQMPVLTQQHTSVSQLVNMPPPSLGVPPPQLVQPPPAVTLPPPGIHIPAHQGPLVPQQQGVVQQQILQQPPPSIPPTGLPPPTQPGHIQHQVLSQPPPNVSQAPPTSVAPPATAQQTQAFITHATYPVQYIQAANGQTLMAYQTQPQVKTDAAGQVQLIQTQPGQPQQLQLIPGTQQLLMQQPQQQVTMLLQYQQQNELGKGGRLSGQQRLATPVQIQLQPGVQLINPQLLQSGQTQFQLQLQQPLAQQLLQQAVRAVTPHQVSLQQTRLPHQQVEQQIQLQQQHIFQLQQQAPPQQLQQQNLQIQPNTQVQPHSQIIQQQLHIQQNPQQMQQQPLQQPQQQTQQPQQQLQQPQQQIQQQLQQPPQQQLQQPQQPQQQLQQQPPQQQLQQPQQPQQQLQQQPPQQQLQQQQQQLQQSQQQLHQSQVQQSQQHMQHQQHLQQQQQTQQSQQQNQQPEQQNQHQQVHLQSPPPVQQQMQQNKETLQQKNQFQKLNPSHQNQQHPPNMGQTSSQPQQGQKRRYEDNLYQGPPQPVPPPKVPPPKQTAASGIGNGPNMAQKPAAATMSQLLPQIQKQLMPPPPPPQQGAPDDWRNNQPDQMPRGEQHQGNRQERPTFNHYSSKPQLYNAAMPFHMQGLGAYKPPPPPPPPAPFYQQPPQGNQYPYFMMHHQQ